MLGAAPLGVAPWAPEAVAGAERLPEGVGVSTGVTEGVERPVKVAGADGLGLGLALSLPPA
jgi:hypothetical protein